MPINETSFPEIFKTLIHDTKTHLFISAYNKIGVGIPSNVETARTKGVKPIPPSAEQQISDVNVTSVTLNLEAWSDGGCKISHFIVEYRNSNIWIVGNYTI